MTWRPEGIKGYGRPPRPEVGDVIAYARRAWTVRNVDPDIVLSDEDEERLEGYRPEYREQMRPYRLALTRLYGAKHERENEWQEIAIHIPVACYDAPGVYPNGRVPLCSCHGEPWPCLEADQQAHAEEELKRAEKVLNLMPGCCPACEEPVTARQKSITFGGPNVRNPLAEGPTFHLRRQCRSAAARYEDLWVADEPGRLRSLLTLRCEGTVIVHGDGTGECFGSNGSDCPSIFAQHRGAMACYWQTHGCGRECARDGHPGTRLVNRPTDPRSVTA